jgi:pimeloyl-ACP methyl ester carboxylesterase
MGFLKIGMRGDTRSRHFAEQFRVIVPDLRGYGASQKPASGYDKKTMARDIRELMVCLGIERAAIIGHDRGARVGLRFAKDIPEMTTCFAALDNIPTLTIFDRMNAAVPRTHWFSSLMRSGIFQRCSSLDEKRRGYVTSFLRGPTILRH